MDEERKETVVRVLIVTTLLHNVGEGVVRAGILSIKMSNRVLIAGHPSLSGHVRFSWTHLKL